MLYWFSYLFVATLQIRNRSRNQNHVTIMDTLRVVIRKMSGLEVIFVVRYLKVNSGWAWVETDPTSADGKEHYEPMVGLLHKKNGRWTYYRRSAGICHL